MDFFSEDDLFATENIQNKLARESLEEYAEEHFGFATPKEKIFKERLNDDVFFEQAYDSLVAVSNLIYSASMLSVSNQDIYNEQERRFLIQSQNIDSDLLIMRIFMLQNYKRLLIEDNFNLENIQVYNERIINLNNKMKKIESN